MDTPVSHDARVGLVKRTIVKIVQSPRVMRAEVEGWACGGGVEFERM